MRHCWNIWIICLISHINQVYSTFHIILKYLDKDFNQKIYKKRNFTLTKLKSKKVSQDRESISKKLWTLLFNTRLTTNPRKYSI